MTTTKHVPLPDSPEFSNVINKWAALTGIDKNDPICITTAHIYGLYEILLTSQNDVTGDLHSVEQRLFGIDDELGKIYQRLFGIDDELGKIYQRLERIDESLIGLKGKEVQAFSGDRGKNINVLKLFQDISDRLTALEKSNLTLELHKKHVYLIMKGIVILNRTIQQDTNKVSAPTSTIPNIDQKIEAESAKLSGSMAKSGYKVVPFNRSKKLVRWLQLFISDIDARTLINSLALIIGLALMGAAIGVGMQYAQSNKWFDGKPTNPVPSSSPISPVAK
jgi:hypothetical protein